MAIISWLGEAEKDFERGEQNKMGRSGRLERADSTDDTRENEGEENKRGKRGRLERGESTETRENDKEGKTTGRRERLEREETTRENEGEGKKRSQRGRLEKDESTETRDTRLSCVDEQPDNPLDMGLFTVTPRKMGDTLIADGRGDDLKRGAQDDPLDLKKPYTVSSRQLEGEGMRVARGESAFLSKSEVMCVNLKVWLADHVLGYVALSQHLTKGKI